MDRETEALMLCSDMFREWAYSDFKICEEREPTEEELDEWEQNLRDEMGV